MQAPNTFPKFQPGVFTHTTHFMINTSILFQLHKGLEGSRSGRPGAGNIRDATVAAHVEN